VALALASAAFSAGAPSTPASPVAVWNQVCQKNFEVDGIDDIVAQARDGHVLLDWFDDGLGEFPAG
jgi:hypothetical protein